MMFWKKNDKTADQRSAAATHGRSGDSAPPGGPLPSDAPGTLPAAAAGATGAAGADAPAPEAAAGPVTPIDATMIEAKVIEAIRTCYDPEIPVNIYELGLIYEVDVKQDGEVAVKMTLTSPMCPVAGTLPHEVEAKVASVKGVRAAHVDVVWDPPWTPEKMSEAAKLQLGML